MNTIWKCKCGWIGTELFIKKIDNGCASDGLPCYVDDSHCPKCGEYPTEAKREDIIEFLANAEEERSKWEILWNDAKRNERYKRRKLEESQNVIYDIKESLKELEPKTCGLCAHFKSACNKGENNKPACYKYIPLPF